MASKQYGQLYVLGTRITLIDSTGAAVVGASSGYLTNAIAKVTVGLEYETADAITSVRGDGNLCINLPQTQTVKNGVIQDFQFCYPDPIVQKMLIGGSVLLETTEEIGYAAPRTGTEPVPDGVAVEFWTRNINNGSFATDLPYVHWVAPRMVNGRLAQNLNAEPANPMLLQVQGELQENPGWTDPYTDWDYTSTSVWQWAAVATIPDFDPPAYVAVA